MTEPEVNPAAETPMSAAEGEPVLRNRLLSPEAKARAAALLQYHVEKMRAAGGIQALFGLCSGGDETDEEVERALEELS